MPTAPASPNEGDLLAQARQGNHAAFIELARGHDERLRRLADLLLHDLPTMEDVLQRCYVTAYGSVGQSRAGRDVGAWLFRIAYNACVDALRPRKQSVPAVVEALAEVTEPEGALRSALAGLPVAQRVAVVLVDAEGFSEAEVAEILGVDPDKVASRLRRARSTLRKALPEAPPSDTGDEAVRESVQLLPILVHGPQFWEAVAHAIAPEAPRALVEPDTEAQRPAPAEEPGPATARHLAIDAKPPVVPISLRRTSNVVLLLLALAAAVIVVVAGLTLVGNRSDSGMAPGGRTDPTVVAWPSSAANVAV